MSNPLIDTLNARLPGETFILPSQGIFYQDGELDESAIDGKIHLHPMTGLDEITMKSPDKLLSGQAVCEVISRCAPQVKKPHRLLANDVNYILMALRLITYGPEIELIYTHTCPNATQRHYLVPIQPILVSAQSIDPTSVETKYTVELPNKQLVVMQPARFEHIIKIYQATIDHTNDQIEQLRILMLDALAGSIASVDNITDPKLILEWVHAISAGWIDALNTKAGQNSKWGMDPVSEIICSDCGEKILLEVPVNPINFFM